MNIRIIYSLVVLLALHAGTSVGMLSRAGARGAAAWQASRLANPNLPATAGRGFATQSTWEPTPPPPAQPTWVTPPPALSPTTRAARWQFFKSKPSAREQSMTTSTMNKQESSGGERDSGSNYKQYGKSSRLRYAAAGTGILGAALGLESYLSGDEQDPLVQSMRSKNEEVRQQHSQLLKSKAPRAVLKAYNFFIYKMENELALLLQQYAQAKESADAQSISDLKASLADLSDEMNIGLGQSGAYINNQKSLNRLIDKYDSAYELHNQMFPDRAGKQDPVIKFDSSQALDNQIQNSTNALLNEIFYQEKQRLGRIAAYWNYYTR